MQNLLVLGLGLWTVTSFYQYPASAFYLETNMHGPQQFVRPIVKPQAALSRASPRKPSFFEIDIPMVADQRQVDRIRNNCRMRKEKRENNDTVVTTETPASTTATSSPELTTTTHKSKKTTQFPPGIQEIIDASKKAKKPSGQPKLTKAEIFSSVEFEIEDIDVMTPEELVKMPVAQQTTSHKKTKKQTSKSKAKSTTTTTTEVTTTPSTVTETTVKETAEGKPEEKKTRRETNVQKILSSLEQKPAVELVKLVDEPTMTNFPLELDLSEFSGEKPEKAKRETEPTGEDLTPMLLNAKPNEAKVQKPKSGQWQKVAIADLGAERTDRMNNALQSLMTLVNALAQVDSYLTSRAKLGIRKLAKIFELDEELEKQNRQKRKL